MDTTAKTIGILAIVAVLAVGGYFLLNNGSLTGSFVANNQDTNDTRLNDAENPDGVNIDIDANLNPKTHEITYTSSGFSPAEITINVGDTVTWKNQTAGNMWVGSAMHPTHMVYSGTSLTQHCPDPENNDFDQCQSGGPNTSWSFTFTKAGTWGYHDHVNVGKFGKVIVQ